METLIVGHSYEDTDGNLIYIDTSENGMYRGVSLLNGKQSSWFDRYGQSIDGKPNLVFEKKNLLVEFISDIFGLVIIFLVILLLSIGFFTLVSMFHGWVLK